MKGYQAADYVKKKLMHSGKRAQLWLVQDKLTGRECLLRELEGESTLYARLVQLDLTGLPQIYCVGTQAGKTCVVEEYLSGQTMADYLEHSGLMTEAQVRDMALVLCDILMQLHANHIIHRDIKPENIFLTDAGEYKLIDFDAARVWKEKQDSDTVCIGTRHYAAPEQYGSQQTDGRSDIYSLGVTLRQLLGSSEVRPVFLEILAKCTEFDAARRFQSCQELKKALQGTDIPIARWECCYHVYHIRWLILVICLIMIILAWQGGDTWKDGIPYPWGMIILPSLCAAKIYWQRRQFFLLKDLLRFLPRRGTVPRWKRFIWWLVYVPFWLFALLGFLAGMQCIPEQFVVVAAFILSFLLTWFTVRWRVAKSDLKNEY
jgi:hypothetical protein